MSKKTKRAAKAASPSQKKPARATPVPPAPAFTVLKPGEVALAKRAKRPSMFDPAVSRVAKALLSGEGEQHLSWPIPDKRDVDVYRAQVYNGMRRSLKALQPAIAGKTSVSVRLDATGKSFVVTLKVAKAG